jgi:hypothetical protein
LDSSQALVQAASGLEKLMTTNKTTAHLKDSTVAQISAAVYYQSQVMSKITSNRSFQKKFRDTVFGQINEDFGNYVDAKARTSPKSLHHVYEWGQAGSQESRLFKLRLISPQGVSFKIGYEFKPSKSAVPNKISNKRYIFKNKAEVMESGKTVIIAPRHSERIVFEVNGYVVFMPKGVSVTVTRPGGTAAKKSFETAYKFFFTGQLVNLSIKKSGFQKIFNSNITKAMRLPGNIKKVSYSFSPNSLKIQADTALTAAFGGVL